MTLLRKITAALLMGLAVVGLLVCLAGLVVAWAFNTPATEALTGLLQTTDGYLNLAGQTAGSAAALVTDVTQRVAAVEQAAGDLSADQQAAIEARVEELAQRIARLSGLAAAGGDMLAGLNDTIRQLNRVPGVNIPQPQADLTGISDTLGAASTKLDELHAVVTAAEVDGSRAAAAAAALSVELQAAQVRLAQWTTGIGATQAAIQAVNARVPDRIDRISILVTLLALLFGAGQVSLFVLARRSFR